MEDYIIQKGDWFTTAHKNNPSDEEVLVFAQSLRRACPAVVKRVEWRVIDNKGQVCESYEILKEFYDYDPSDVLYTRLCIAGIVGWLPITLL